MVSYILITTYILVICTIFGNSIQRFSKWNRKFFGIISFGLMILLMGLRRTDIGNDTQAYLNFYNQMCNKNFSYDPRMETGFRYFTIAISKLIVNENAFLLICVLVSFLPIIIFFNKFTYKTETCIALFWLLGCISFTSATRQGIAMAIVLCGIIYWASEKKFATAIYSLFCILAALFHASSIILLVLPFLNKIRISAKRMLILGVLSVIAVKTNFLLWFFSKFVGDYYAGYISVQSGWAASVFNMTIGLVAIIIEVFTKHKFISYYKIPDNQNHLYTKNMNMFRWASLLYSSCCIMSINSGIMGRAAVFFIPFLIVYIVNNVYLIRYSNLILISIYLALIGYSILALIIRPEWNSFFPYYFFWQE